MGRIKPVARVIDEERWHDAENEDVLYWTTRPFHERIEFARDLLLSAYRRTHGRPIPRMSKVGRVFTPEP